MNRAATLARVIGLTRSFPSLAFERGSKDEPPEATATITELTVTGSDKATTLVDAMAIARVTTVDAEAVAPEELFDEIEADMASLLATIDEIGERPAGDMDAAEEADDGGDAPISALLSELNRLWLAEPAERTIN